MSQLSNVIEYEFSLIKKKILQLCLRDYIAFSKVPIFSEGNLSRFHMNKIIEQWSHIYLFTSYNEFILFDNPFKSNWNFTNQASPEK